MDITRVNVVLHEMNKYKNYDEFMNLLSFDERKYILYNFANFFETYRIFNDERFFKYFFSEEESNLLYDEVNIMSETSKFFLALSGDDELKKKIIPLVSEDFKSEIINNLENEKNKIAMFDLINDDYNKAFLLRHINDLQLKLNYIKKINLNLINNYSIFSALVETINDNNTLIEIMNFLIKEYPDVDVCKHDTIIKFSNDELKLKYIDTVSIVYQLFIIKTLADDYKKVDFVKNIKINNDDISQNNGLCDVICSLKDDALILQNLYLLGDNNFNIARVLKSLKSDELKLKKFHLAGDYQYGVFASIKSDTLKINNIDLLSKQLFSNFNQVIDSIENIEQRFELISKYINNINIYGLVHADYLDKVKTIYPRIISAVAIYYQIDNNNLTKLIEKYGYNTIKFLENNNIKALINYSQEDFDKTLKIFEMQKAKQLEMKDVDDIIGSLLQREFRFNNRKVVSIFSDLETFIDNKNINEIIAKLEEINKTFNINEILLQYNLSYEEFLNGLLSEKVEFKNILHEITDKYINLKRDEYLLENKEQIKKELNLEKSYEKNYLLDKLFTYVSIDRIYNLIVNLDKKNLNNEQLELINNEDLLRECLVFRKNPKEYSGDFSVKSKIKLLNQILTQLYLSKEIDYLGENDLDAKIIFKVKPSDKDSVFKIMQEINFKKLKDNILSNQELYDKLLKIMETYHFLGWNDMFENLLSKADLIFDESSIGILISYFYDFYPKLEEKVRIGKLKNISLTSIIDEISVYGSSSTKYKYLLGIEDYSIFLTNSGPNAAYIAKEDRLKEIPEKIKGIYSRRYVTIPPVNKNIKLNGNKTININVGNVTESINFTYGERTGACMRIGGAGRTLFDFCLLNKNGFHVSFNNPDSNEFVSRVSGFRNGNTVFLNQLRNSLSDEYSDEDLYYAIKEFCNMLVELTKDSEYPIKNVVVSDGFAMRNYEKEKTILEVDPREGFYHFYTDLRRDNVIYLTKNAEIELGPDNSEKYEVSRKKIDCFTSYEDIKNALQQMKLVEGLIKDFDLEDIELYNEDFIKQISKLYIGEDWFIALGQNNEMIYKYIIERDEISKRKSEYELSMVEESIHNLSINNYEIGGRSL